MEPSATKSMPVMKTVISQDDFTNSLIKLKKLIAQGISYDEEQDEDTAQFQQLEQLQLKQQLSQISGLGGQKNILYNMGRASFKQNVEELEQYVKEGNEASLIEQYMPKFTSKLPTKLGFNLLDEDVPAEVIETLKR